MWSAISLISTILGGAGGIVALGQWADLDDNWRYGAIGFIGGLMVVLIPGILLWDSPYRQAKREREKKKIELVQAFPSRQDRLEELQIDAERLDLEIANMKIDAENQKKAARSMFNQAPDWMSHSSNAVAGKKQNEIFMKEQDFERLLRQQARLLEMSDEQWLEEQEAKIYVPD